MAEEPKRRLKAATWPTGDYDWGIYVERLDGEVWTPLIYDGHSRSEARAGLPGYLGEPNYRNAAVVRRLVSPWEVSS